MYKCAFCGKELDDVEAHFFEDVCMCEDCLEEKTRVCVRCGDTIWESDAVCEDDMILCDHCYTYHYVHCQRCGHLIPECDVFYDDDSDDPYCEECYRIVTARNSILNYSYKPSPIFYGEGLLYLGVELEIDGGGERDRNAGEILRIGNNSGDRIYCKHDGSLNDGFEIVSHPMTLDYHTQSMNWREIFRKAVEMDYRSHETETCGLHCHVNRTAFGETEEQQEAAIARIVFFVESHWNELLKFSRRRLASINRWASRYGISENTSNTYKNAKNSRLGRYVAVNLENQNTIEFRIFRGTLCYNTFIATIQLVYEICLLCLSKTDSEVEGQSWSTFVENIRDKPELISYLKAKRLYVNESTAESEDI